MPVITTYSCHHVSFDGTLLHDGFWLYIWRITHKSQCFIYVGMTGDKASGKARSPFSRMAAHFGSNTNNNAITRNLNKLTIDPEECLFAMLAIGPIFEKQEGDKSLHDSLCDKVEALEKALAEHLTKHNYQVISTHHNRRGSIKPDPQILKEIISKAEYYLSDAKIPEIDT